MSFKVTDVLESLTLQTGWNFHNEQGLLFKDVFPYETDNLAIRKFYDIKISSCIMTMSSLLQVIIYAMFSRTMKLFALKFES